MSAASAPRWFPLGLHVTLLFAAGALAFPAASSRAEELVQWLTCLPLRALPSPDTAALAAADAEVMGALSVEGLRRQRARALRWQDGGPAAGAVARVSRVLQRRAPGAAGRATLLVLDRTWADVADCRSIVTSGGTLVGWLGAPGDLPDHDPATGFALVRCVHHRSRTAPPRRLRAAVELGTDHPSLRLVLEPGSRIDPWPLRCALVEDPYLASSLAGGGQPVFSRDPRGSSSWSGDLLVGYLRVWGYAAVGGSSLPIGFYVEPAFDPQAIATVVLWTERGGTAAGDDNPRDALDEVPLRSVPLPGGGRRRFVVARDGPATSLPRGAAVVAAGSVLVGVVDRSSRGHAVVSEFGADARPWSLVLVPQDPDLAPREVVGVAFARDAATVDLAVEAALVPGLLLTGANGMHCPTGLVVGDARPLDAHTVLVLRPSLGGELAACVRRRGGR